MKRTRRYKQKHHTKRCLAFEAAPLFLSRGALGLPILFISNTKNELVRPARRCETAAIQHGWLAQNSTRMLEHSRVDGGAQRRTM